MKARFFLSTGCLAALVLTCRAGDILIPRGEKSTWQYLDAGQAAGKDWTTAGFDASKWKSGPAPLGYSEDDLKTKVSFGRNAASKPVTTYFRCTVEVPDPAKVEKVLLNLRRDDGAVAYWNGKEVFRSNMPEGAIAPDTSSVEALNDEDEGEFHPSVMPAKDTVVKGPNVIAVEVHQCDPRSSDLIFDLEAVLYAPGEEIPAQEPAPAPAKTARDESALDKAYAAAPENMEVAYAWVRARVDARRDLTIQPVKRAVPAEVPKEFRFIADTPPSDDDPGEKPVSRGKLLADVDDLELILENCYAYLERRGADYRGALDALRASLTKDTPLRVFTHRVERLLTIFGDPHSAVRSVGPRTHHPPVLFVMDGGKLAALTPGRSGYFTRGFPYCTEIKGRPVAEWIAAAEHIVPQASPQYRRYMALSQLSDVVTVAREMSISLEPDSPVPAVFESADGKERKTANLETARSGGGGRWRAGDSEVRSDGIGYLRLTQMATGDRFIASLNDWMVKFKDTRGLIIDVRGNSGGTQDAIKTLLPWLMKPGSPLKVVNVAAYRLPVKLPKSNPSGFLGLFGRGLHPVTSAVWTPQQASELKAFLKTWEPKWKLPAGKFSDWHLMALNHESNPEAGFYDKPVIVLMDERCYSATDNFLGALKGHPNVTLMGTTSGGGSGRMANYVLPNTHIELTLCQMASFASNGQTYDGNGVIPDVVAEPKLEDQLAGHGDSVLDAAVARLKK
jgi:hypothetical protein